MHKRWPKSFRCASKLAGSDSDFLAGPVSFGVAFGGAILKRGGIKGWGVKIQGKKKKKKTKSKRTYC